MLYIFVIFTAFNKITKKYLKRITTLIILALLLLKCQAS